jgi:Concanavalin A-like lectin/glucanases superfamily
MYRIKPSTYILYGIAIVLFVGILSSCKKNSSQAIYNTSKTALNAAIDSLTTVYNSTVDGTKPGQYAPGARAALDSVIALATTVTNSTAYTQQQVNNALNNLLAAGATFSTQLIQQVSSANLMGYWEFNGNAMDSSGNGNNGVLQTGWIGTSAAAAVDGATLPVLVPDRFGRPNMAYYFNNGATVKVPYSSVFNAQTFTILLWLKRDGTNANNYMFSLDRWLGYKFQLQSGNLPFLTVNTSTGDHDQDDGGIAIDSAGVWRHVAVSFTPGTEKFYIQGKLVSVATVTGTPLPVSSVINLAIGNELPKENYNLTNSNDPNYFYGGDYFMGALDEVRFYNTVLTDAEILSIYTDESSL